MTQQIQDDAEITALKVYQQVFPQPDILNMNVLLYELKTPRA